MSTHRTIKFRAWMGKRYAEPDCDFGKDEWYAGIWPIFKGSLEDLIEKGFVLEQFTGILDKNGKEIYEGDVIEFDTTKDNGFKITGGKEVQVVEYKDGAWHLGPYYQLAYAHRDYQLEVVGNIHENPELLKS